MRFLTGEQFERLIEGGRILRGDSYGPKVYQVSGQRIVKLFRIKRWLSLSLVYPYSIRFLRNTLRLKKRGFRCVETQGVFYCHAVRRHGVIYERLQGEPLDKVFAENSAAARAIFLKSAAYIARLHKQRIYFRSLHPGNILLLPDGEFGLIDVADLRFPLLPLSLEQRRRNFRHLFRSREFAEASRIFAVEDFFSAYLQATDLSEPDRTKLAEQLRESWQRQQA